MPQTDNKVEWCLNKAKRELQEGKKHRGLIRIAQNIEEAKNHIAKAEHNFKAAIIMEETKMADWSVNAAFYAIYHCFLAIITKYGYESRNQECTIALMKLLKEQGKTNLDSSIIEAFDIKQQEEQESSIINLRENFQYGTETKIEDQKLKRLKEICKKAIEQTKKEILAQE